MLEANVPAHTRRNSGCASAACAVPQASTRSPSTSASVASSGEGSAARNATRRRYSGRTRLSSDFMARNEALRAELLALAERPADPLGAERLWSILDDYEAWPGRKLVGDDGEH